MANINDIRSPHKGNIQDPNNNNNKSENFTIQKKLKIRHLGQVDYLKTWREMQNFTNHRTETTLDEIWCLEHPPVFTQGLAGKPEHIIDLKSIPLIQSDRGGQITYHGPGQLIIYFLIDIRRQDLSVRSFVSKIEAAVIQLLADYNLQAAANPKQPGVYIEGGKICSLGLRIRRGASFHGLSLNVDMDLTPFEYINPCGFTDLKMKQIRDYLKTPPMEVISNRLLQHFADNLGYTEICSDILEEYAQAKFSEFGE
jgi:lipoyl(octanoyl) transferase